MCKDNQINSIACGEEHTLILRNNGELLVCGSNFEGEIGLGETLEKVLVPTILMKDEKIRKICCGSKFSIILKEDEVWGFGNNCDYSQMLLARAIRFCHTPRLLMKDEYIASVWCAYGSVFVLKKDGELLGWGYSYSGQLNQGSGDTASKGEPVRVMKDENIVQVAGGADHTVVLMTNGQVWGFGLSENGQLGDTKMNNIWKATKIEI